MNDYTTMLLIFFLTVVNVFWDAYRITFLCERWLYKDIIYLCFSLSLVTVNGSSDLLGHLYFLFGEVHYDDVITKNILCQFFRT